MRWFALFFLSALPALALDLREVRFPFGDEKELTAFIAATEPQLGEVQQRVWRNGLKWMREHCERKRLSFWSTLRGMSATSMVLMGYVTHAKLLADEIEALARAARAATGEEQKRLKARVLALSQARDAIWEEADVVLSRPARGTRPDH